MHFVRVGQYGDATHGLKLMLGQPLSFSSNKHGLSFTGQSRIGPGSGIWPLHKYNGSSGRALYSYKWTNLSVNYLKINLIKCKFSSIYFINNQI